MPPIRPALITRKSRLDGSQGIHSSEKALIPLSNILTNMWGVIETYELWIEMKATSFLACSCQVRLIRMQ